MAEFIIKTDNDDEFSTLVIKGRVEQGELITFVKSFYSNERVPLAFWDLRQADLSNIYGEELENLIQYLERNFEQRKGARSALLADSELAFGLARMLEAQWELKELPLQIRVFRKHQEALDWLNAKN